MDEYIQLVQQFVLTPFMQENNRVSIDAGARIYDRNGYLVLEPASQIMWTGTDSDNQPLPMGSYTVVDAGGETKQVTIIR